MVPKIFWPPQNWSFWARRPWIEIKGPVSVFSIFRKILEFHSFLKIPLKCLFEYGPSSYEQKKTPFGGGFCSRGPNVKNQFFGKKIFGQIFWKKYFAQLMRNFFLILKWFYFLSFAQNWPICEGLKFSLLKMDNFPFQEKLPLEHLKG